MNRNVESHFAELPSAQIERSIFDRSASHKTSFNVGELIPFFFDEVLPGDTFNVSTSLVARLQTLLTPIMDNVYLDTYYFFVPARLTWPSHWKNFMGENSDSAWIPATTYPMPKISSPDNGWNVGTIADYLGIPTGVEFKPKSDTSDGLMPDALPFRGYALICNEWFRDQNVTDPLNIPLGDSDQTGSNGDSYVNDVANGGKPFKVAKYHDYFTSCLPNAQKAQPVTFGATPIVSMTGSPFPVLPGDEDIAAAKFGGKSLHFKKPDGTAWETPNNHALYFSQNNDNLLADSASYTPGSQPTIVVPSNLYADLSDMTLSSTGVSFTINELRLAFQLQKFYEKQARAGSRYREIILEMFSVHSPDARMMVPEYLGGTRIPIQIHQIANTAESSTSDLGDLGAMSNTADIHEDFVKSFTEHGYVYGLCCVRYDHSYPQGLNKSFVHDSYLDYYWPVFANIGEQPVYKYEIDATIREDEDRMSVFGYQEAYANYRYKPARVSGEMRPGILNSLASWHLSDYYTEQPSLSDSWIREDKSNVDRVLAVTSSVANQVFADFYVKNICTRAMPMYSIPGLIDHH